MWGAPDRPLRRLYRLGPSCTASCRRRYPPTRALAMPEVSDRRFGASPRVSEVTHPIFVTIVAAEHPARHIPSRTTMRASALSPGHSRVLSGPGSGRIARRARRSVPRTRCMTVTDPSFSSPIGGHVDGEPFSLGLRRDADQALILGEPLGRGAMGVVRVRRASPTGASSRSRPSQRRARRASPGRPQPARR